MLNMSDLDFWFIQFRARTKIMPLESLQHGIDNMREVRWLKPKSNDR
jgi:hypothetical protein